MTVETINAIANAGDLAATLMLFYLVVRALAIIESVIDDDEQK